MKLNDRNKFIFVLIFSLSILSLAGNPGRYNQPTEDDGSWFFLKPEDITDNLHHTRHSDIFGKYIHGYNYYVLQGIDEVQSHAMDGGGYFAGITAIPPESPIGYELKLFENSLLNPARKTSYCSGVTYTAFIESLNLLLSDQSTKLSPERLEAIRMQEPDGGRREDGIKFWGHWNDDGFGTHYAMVQYSGIGREIKPNQARPGDFINISWKTGVGHSVIFLGWYRDTTGEKYMLYWSSQKGTNGMGDQLVSLNRIKEVKVVRLIEPEKLFKFRIDQNVERKIPGDLIDWD